MQKLQSDCFNCVHKIEYHCECHVGCKNPDPNMIGHPHGIKHGWFFYPVLFDPVWMKKECVNYQLKQG